MKAANIIVLSVLSLLLTLQAHAKTEVIYSSYKYVMGDNDTKNDAKRICFLEAKRRLIEKAGVYIESETNVKNSMIKKDEIKAFTAAIIKAEVEKEDIRYQGESIVVEKIIKGEIDLADVNNALKSFMYNSDVHRKVQIQQEKLDEMEKQLSSLQVKLKASSGEDTVILRKERNLIFKGINELDKIVYEMEQYTLKVEGVKNNMTRDEVLRIAGIPRIKFRSYAGKYECWNYGNVWIVMTDGIVKAKQDTNNCESQY